MIYGILFKKDFKVKEYTVQALENTPVVTEELPHVGLTSDEVRAQVEAGNVNTVKEKVGKSYGRIIADNLLTFFNFVWAVVALILISIGSFKNLTFLFIIIPNVLIAIVQEIRAKRTVETSVRFPARDSPLRSAVGFARRVPGHPTESARPRWEYAPDSAQSR